MKRKIIEIDESKCDGCGQCIHADKLVAIVRQAGLRSLTVVRMEVPCCRGLTEVALSAALASTEAFPVEEHVVGIRGGIERRVVRAQADLAQQTG
ncbi:MAG: hypothetical protein MUF54_10710 [Polyangiaceae bacterium]|nr:hypothetical protein [Polyangiaceae bacterium]